ncbi:MAG: TolB family protein [Limisphaerales bacterium]
MHIVSTKALSHARRRFTGCFLLLVLASACAVFAQADGIQAGRAPKLYPDYAGIVLPPNIAPLNFKVEEPGASYRAEFRSTAGKPITVNSRDQSIRIPLGAWKGLVRANPGQLLYCDVSVRDEQGRWNHFTTITNLIAREEIDSYLVYRLLKPLYSVYKNIGIYQRDLESFSERPVLENKYTDGGCLNCHTFLNHRPDTFTLHTRGSPTNNPMLLVLSNEVFRVDKTMGYMSWHPSGRLMAFSANKFSLFYHTHGETRDVFDAQSNLGIYRLDSNSIVLPPAISLPDKNETWPGWSPDGKYLYYCSGPRLPNNEFREVHYDLMRISYDIEQDRWGEPEMLLSAQESGGSASEPKVSPDNRYVLFCRAKYGNFPIYQANSDLYILDLQTRQIRRLNINSDRADTWHCWSASGRWIVFSSKRLDGLFARPFFSYFDSGGEFCKPFVLPQEDPAYYESYLKTFNVPELILGPITVKESTLSQAALKPAKILHPKGETRPLDANGQAAIVVEGEGQKPAMK